MKTPPPSSDQVDESLHRALVGTSRGLLQYASQCRPWTPPAERDRSTLLDRLAVQQRQSIQRLCDLLIERGYPIRWGAFPVDYARYNGVALEYLWPRIADFQVRLVRKLEAVRNEVRHDRSAQSVLDDVLASEREICEKLASASGSSGARPQTPYTRLRPRSSGSTKSRRTFVDRRSRLRGGSPAGRQTARKPDHATTALAERRTSRQTNRVAASV